MTWGWIVALCLLAGVVNAGELSDCLACGDAKALKRHGFVGTGHRETLRARIGTVDEKLPCVTSGDEAGDAFEVTLRKQRDRTCALQIREVYPPESPGVRYTYEVYANGKLVYVRDYRALMFGPVSYFINLDDPETVGSSQIRLRFANRRAGTPLRISAIWLYSDFPGYCESAGIGIPFYLAPLLDETPDISKREQEFKYLKRNIRPSANSDVRLGCAEEHGYMNRDPARARKQFEDLLNLSRKYDMPLGLSFVSWWSGTPVRYPDGEGGTFGDPEYQQICWSVADDYDEGDGLRKLLGDRWDIRYGWTVPNRWSSVPWLTMNHPRLNAARHKAIGEKLGILDRKSVV